MAELIILARHGQTASNAEGRFQGVLDIPLNAEGKRQAQKLAPLIAQFKPGRIFTSDLTRSIETARPVAALLGLQPVADPVFREYSWGILEGLTWEEAVKRYPAVFPARQPELRTVKIPQAEPLSAFRQRVQAGLSLLLSAKEASVALIGHGRYLNVLMVEFLGLDFNGPWPFAFASAAVSVLQNSGGRRRLLCFNEKCHLKGDLYA
ncbi:MAG: histidine phosphatase family protein [Firmicutes bacterium]|nr:histidine phosphatase family protein [Bacillota bacterium]